MTLKSKQHREGRPAWAWGICAAALTLAACDADWRHRTDAAVAEVARSQPAAQALAPVAPASSATLPPAAAPAGDEVHVPYVARQGEAGLDSLSGFLGKYPYDGVNYLRQGVLAERLKSLMADDYELLLSNLGTIGPLTEEGAAWSLIGLRPHHGGEESAAVVIDPQRNALRVWLFSQGRERSFTDVDGPDIAWPPSVRTSIGNTTEMNSEIRSSESAPQGKAAHPAS